MAVCLPAHIPRNHAPGLAVPAEVNAAAIDKSVLPLWKIMHAGGNKNGQRPFIMQCKIALPGLMGIDFAVPDIIYAAGAHVAPQKMKIPERAFVTDALIVQRHHRAAAHQ